MGNPRDHRGLCAMKSLGCQGRLYVLGAISYQSGFLALDMLISYSVRWAGMWILDTEPWYVTVDWGQEKAHGDVLYCGRQGPTDSLGTVCNEIAMLSQWKVSYGTLGCHAGKKRVKAMRCHSGIWAVEPESVTGEAGNVSHGFSVECRPWRSWCIKRLYLLLLHNRPSYRRDWSLPGR
uniref:Uncharacterized protein n=1 Tax=Molossus molossus TaxID=27622 RepID=A0A7J8BIS0_MOLMO|nr:hypothetical protein HJG59_010439 [Molossus molossus]